MHEHAADWGWIAQFHLLLALVIAAAYFSIPFIPALRRFSTYLPRVSVISGSFFFLTCALTHVAIAAGFHDSPWMVLSDFVQAVSVVTFIVSVSRLVGKALNRLGHREHR